MCTTSSRLATVYFMFEGGAFSRLTAYDSTTCNYSIHYEVRPLLCHFTWYYVSKLEHKAFNSPRPFTMITTVWPTAPIHPTSPDARSAWGLVS